MLKKKKKACTEADFADTNVLHFLLIGEWFYVIKPPADSLMKTRYQKEGGNASTLAHIQRPISHEHYNVWYVCAVHTFRIIYTI